MNRWTEEGQGLTSYALILVVVVLVVICAAIGLIKTRPPLWIVALVMAGVALFGLGAGGVASILSRHR